MQSDAHDALVNALAQHQAAAQGYEVLGPPATERELEQLRAWAEEDLDAVLFARPDVQCERCGGNGVDPDLTGGYEGTPSFRDVEACVNCHGAGTVPGPLALISVLPDGALREAVQRAIERGVLERAQATGGTAVPGGEARTTYVGHGPLYRVVTP